MGWFKISVIVLVTAIFVVKLPHWFEGSRPVVFGGYSSKGWEKVGKTFKKNVESGLERGAAFAVYHKGELVAQYFGGYADVDAFVPWDHNVLTTIFSTTKFLAALMIGMLVDRGLLDYDQPVSKYWPEFAENGKKDVTVAQLMSHQVGLVYLDQEWKWNELVDDPEGLGKKLASQTPNWKPGSKHGYHGITIGLYADQIIRHVDPKHRACDQFFAEEIAKPFDLDIFIGLPKEESYRCARVVLAPAWDPLFHPKAWPYFWRVMTMPNSASAKMTGPFAAMMEKINSQEYRREINPSALGFGTATSLAKLMGIVGNGGKLGGKQLLTLGTIKKMGNALSTGLDEVLRANTTFSVGPMLLESPLGSAMIGHPGAGGQMGFADPEYQLGIAYITNYMATGLVTGDERYQALRDAVYETVLKLQEK